MLRVVNLTPFQVDSAVLVDETAQQVWVVVAKATFSLTANGTELADDQEAVCAAPEYTGEPGASSLRRDIELVTDHPGTDITLNATAHAPRGKPVQRLVTKVSVGSMTKSLQIVGNRRHRRWIERKPEPFVRMPIRYELACGGRTGPRTADIDSRNPLGRGRYSPNAEGRMLPNIYPLAPRMRGDEPDGLGAVPASWSPRREFAGTFDDAWKRDRMPLWPDDFDPRYYLSAPRGLVASPHLRGGERVELTNLSVHGTWTFRLPRYYLTTETFLGANRFRRVPQLDRVIIEPDDARLVMVWRMSLPCGIRCREIDRTVVDFKPFVSL